MTTKSDKEQPKSETKKIQIPEAAKTVLLTFIGDARGVHHLSSVYFADEAGESCGGEGIANITGCASVLYADLGPVTAMFPTLQLEKGRLVCDFCGAGIGLMLSDLRTNQWPVCDCGKGPMRLEVPATLFEEEKTNAEENDA